MATKTAKKGGKVKVGIKEEGPPLVKAEKPTGKPPKRIRMLITVGNKDGCYITGNVYKVPHEVPVDTARRWIRSGAAEVVFEPVEPEPIGPKETK